MEVKRRFRCFFRAGKNDVSLSDWFTNTRVKMKVARTSITIAGPMKEVSPGYFSLMLKDASVSVINQLKRAPSKAPRNYAMI